MQFNGFQLHPAALDAQAQSRLVALALAAAETAPFHRQQTPGGKAMSVAQTSVGRYGWVSDRTGYRYEERHPLTDETWPPMPDEVLALWNRFAGASVPPDSCLINLYREGAKMGLHQDMDEADRDTPVLSISLGDTALFRLGGMNRSDPTRSFRLASGDVCLLAGASRMAFHGVDRILPGSSQLIPGGGRINLTLRRAKA
jgi:alkylated DNA repair protein (DNA oxidative demethylase)